jgi:hypothetical protein
MVVPSLGTAYPLDAITRGSQAMKTLSLEEAAV